MSELSPQDSPIPHMRGLPETNVLELLLQGPPTSMRELSHSTEQKKLNILLLKRMNYVNAQVDKLFNCLCMRAQSAADERLEQVITSYKKQICDAILVAIATIITLFVFVAFSVYALIQQELLNHLIASLLCIALIMLHIRRSGTGLMIFERLVELGPLKVRVRGLLEVQLQKLIKTIRPSFITDDQAEKIANFDDWEDELSIDEPYPLKNYLVVEEYFA